MISFRCHGTLIQYRWLKGWFLGLPWQEVRQLWMTLLSTFRFFYTNKKCCFCVTDVTRARHFPMNLISLSKLCVDCLKLLMFESQDSDNTNLKNCAKYCLHSRNIVVVIYTYFVYVLMQQYLDFYHRRLVPTQLVSAKTVSVLVNFSYSSVH